MTRSEEAQHFRVIFRRTDDAGRLKLALELRDIAIEFLRPVIAGIPRAVSDSARAAYQAKGISLAWDLATADAYEFYFMARGAGLTASQQSAAELLIACAQALEDGTVPERLQTNIIDAYARLDADNVDTGKLFTQGRKKGALSLIAKRVAAYLAKHPRAPAMEVWEAIEARPPKGFRLINSTELGRYVEQGAAEVMRWRNFQNVVSKQRPANAKRGRRKST